MKYDILYFDSTIEHCTYNTQIRASHICIFANRAFEFYIFGVQNFTFVNPSELRLKVSNPV
jgi:hypothetical protein